MIKVADCFSWSLATLALTKYIGPRYRGVEFYPSRSRL